MVLSRLLRWWNGEQSGEGCRAQVEVEAAWFAHDSECDGCDWAARAAFHRMQMSRQYPASLLQWLPASEPLDGVVDGAPTDHGALLRTAGEPAQTIAVHSGSPWGFSEPVPRP